MAETCSATSKQSGERCRRWASPGHEVCVIHGSKSLRGPESGNYRHGERAKFVRRDAIPAIVERLAEIARPDGPKHVVQVNLADRARRRDELLNPEIDTVLALDDADRKDVVALMAIDESQRDDTPTAAPIIQIANVSALAVTLVRGPDGTQAKLATVDGVAYLLTPCEEFEHPELQARCWRPVAQLERVSES